MSNPAELEQRLEEIAGAIQRVDLQAKVEQFRRLKGEFELRHAIAISALRGAQGYTIADKEAAALQAVEDEGNIQSRLATAEAAAEGARAALRALEAEGGFIQTLLAQARAEARYQDFVSSMPQPQQGAPR